MCTCTRQLERESATGPTNLNLNGFVGARAEQSSTFLAASLPPAIPCEASPIPIQFQRENCSGRRQGAVGLAFYFEAGSRAQATSRLLSASRHVHKLWFQSTWKFGLWVDLMLEPAIEIISTIEFVQFMPRMIFSGAKKQRAEFQRRVNPKSSSAKSETMV